MCYLPIHAVMIAFLFEVTGSVPRTETKMYEHFTSFTIIRNLSKEKKIELSYEDEHSLNEEQKQLFKQICQLAFEKTLSNNQVLEAHSFFRVKKHRDISLGLITVDRTAGLYGFKSIYTFQHLTFQEYLAAYHISTLSKEEQMKLIEEHGDLNHMLVVWKFYCGLVEIDENATARLILDKANDNFHYSILCAYESQQPLACDELLKILHYHIKFEDQNLLISDYTAVGYIINSNTSDVPVALSLINIDNMNNEAADALLSEIKHGELELCVRRSTIDTNTQVAFIRQLLTKGSLVELSISAGIRRKFKDSPLAGSKLSIITTLSMPNISRMLRIKDVSFRNLKFLNLKGSVVEDSEFKALASGLKSGENLEHLDVSCNNINNQKARLLAKGLKGCKVLQRFIINENCILPFEMINLLTIIKHQYLKVSDAEIILQNVPQKLKKKDLMKCLTNLQSLDITLEKKDDMQSFYHYAKSWRMLRELSVILEGDMKVICSSLRHFNMLEKLVLSKGIIDMESAKLLKVGCDVCPNLKLVDLHNNKIGSAEREYLLKNLPSNNVLMPPLVPHNQEVDMSISSS